MDIKLGMFNFKCLIFVALVLLASWSFPLGLAIDAGIITLWIFVKFKRKPKVLKRGVKESTGKSDEELYKMMMLMLLSGKMEDMDGDLASEFKNKLISRENCEPSPKKKQRDYFKKQNDENEWDTFSCDY